MLNLFAQYRTVLTAGIVALAFAAGFYSNGVRWDLKYQSREVQIRDAEIKRQKEIAVEWATVARLQDDYKRLNKETYDDLRKRLDAVAASVANYGTRVVRICAARPAPEDPVSGAPARTIADGADGLPGPVAGDSGSSRSTEGYDIYPEVTELMARATVQSVTCGKLIEWHKASRAIR